MCRICTYVVGITGQLLKVWRRRLKFLLRSAEYSSNSSWERGLDALVLNLLNIIAAAAPAAIAHSGSDSTPAVFGNSIGMMHYLLAALAIGATIYCFRSISRAADASPVQMLFGLLRASRTVVIAGLSMVAILSMLLLLEMMPPPIDSVAQWFFDGIVCGIGVVASFFIIRQFAAPPWWRLNAWNPATDSLGERGSVREAVAWILGDARLGLLSMRLLDRIVICVGVPAVVINIAWLTGFERTLQLAFGLLFVLYVALAVALMTANRIPRVLMSRLVDLRHVARRIAGGDLHARVSTHEQGDYEELDELVRDLNSMAKALQQRDAENRTLHERLTFMLQTEQELATRDSLTGLRNRRYFTEALRAELDRSGRTGATCAVAIIDLDNFKQVNDRFGHQEGDAVLQRTAHALLAVLRPYDLACRLGGEEFGVIFPQTRPEEAQVVLDRIMHALSNAGAQGMALTFSGGIASFPDHAQDCETLYRLADEAAYDAKLKGKARNVLYDPVQTKQMDSPERQADKRRADMIGTAKALVATVDAKESMSRNHSETVGRYARQLAFALGNDEAFAEQMYLCGILHDVGKIGLSETIMNKPGRLTREEYSQVQQHSELGAQIVSNAGLRDIALMVRHHHEHFDGSGYPAQLVGEAIPVGSRIIQVAEAFDVMTSDRVYRRAMPPADAIGILNDAAGTTFDPHIVQAMTWLVQTGQIVVGATSPSWSQPYGNDASGRSAAA